MNDALVSHAEMQFVPAGYAEKAMASVMQLHSELMDEKERRVALYRTVLEREQQLAELRAQVKRLEEQLGARTVAAEAQQRPQAVPAVSPATPSAEVATEKLRPRAPQTPPRVPFVTPRPHVEGWKVW